MKLLLLLVLCSWLRRRRKKTGFPTDTSKLKLHLHEEINIISTCCSPLAHGKKSFNSLHSFYLLRFNILFRWNQHQLSMKCLFFFFNFPAIKKSTQKIFNQHQQSHSTKHRMKFPDFFISYEWKKIFWVVQSMKRRYERRNRFQLFLSMKKFKFEKFLRERISARFE